jgi:hypothetical protein
LNTISLLPLLKSNKSVAPPPEIVSGCLVNGLIPVITCPSSVWNSDSPALPSAVLLIGIITACCGPAFVICAVIRLTLPLRLNDISSVYGAPIVPKGFRLANSLSPSCSPLNGLLDLAAFVNAGSLGE